MLYSCNVFNVLFYNADLVFADATQISVQDEWRTRELDMEIKDHRLALKGLLRSLQVQSAQLEKQRMRLLALLGE